MLYMATSTDLPLRESPEITIEEVETSREAVLQWFRLPVVRFIGAHTGCSCGFPSVITETRVDYFEGVFRDAKHRELDLQSVRALLNLVHEHVLASGEIQLYPVWDGDEGLRPKGTIDVRLAALKPETFLLNQQFLYRVARDTDRNGERDAA
jgi:hypothetical protein